MEIIKTALVFGLYNSQKKTSVKVLEGGSVRSVNKWDLHSCVNIIA